MATTDSVPFGPDPVLTAFAACVERQRPDVVLAHSNAGRYAAAVAAGRPVVYVDAALPPPSGDATLAPDALLEHLAGLADTDGLLPPWTHWWSEEDIAAVVPDPHVLAGIRAVEPRMPLSYLRARLGAPPGWQLSRQAFLALGGTYAAELAARTPRVADGVLDGAAAPAGRPRDPDAVAVAVVDLAVTPRGRCRRECRGA